MKGRVESLRRKYRGFRRGKTDAYVVRSAAVSILEEANESGDQKTIEEIEDMLIDLQFSIEEDKCHCHRRCSSC
jgi:hypothetical protein